MATVAFPDLLAITKRTRARVGDSGTEVKFKRKTEYVKKIMDSFKKAHPDIVAECVKHAQAQSNAFIIMPFDTVHDPRNTFAANRFGYANKVEQYGIEAIIIAHVKPLFPSDAGYTFSTHWTVIPGYDTEGSVNVSLRIDWSGAAETSEDE
jgi:hypothetical protein